MGHFIISLNSKGYVVFRFIIRLHVDALEALQQIKNIEPIGVRFSEKGELFNLHIIAS